MVSSLIDHCYGTLVILSQKCAFRCWRQWFIFFKNLFYQKKYKCAMKIGVAQIRGALLLIFIGKNTLLYLCRTLLSISKITPGTALLLWRWCKIKTSQYSSWKNLSQGKLLEKKPSIKASCTYNLGTGEKKFAAATFEGFWVL